MKSSCYLRFLLTLTTVNAAALLPRSPQGESKPGEFIDPTLSYSIPLNNKSPSSGPYVVESGSIIKSANSVNPTTAASASSVAAAAIASLTSAPNYDVLPAPNPGVPLTAVAAASTYSISPAAASSAAAELNAMMDEFMNSTSLYNETYPYWDGYYNGSYNGSHHHHHHNSSYWSSYWNSTNYLNVTEYYNTTNNLVEVITVEPNGTTTTQYYNATEGYGYGYGYGYYNGSHHHNHTGQYNGTNWWTELMANDTDTDTDMAAATTGTGTAVAPLGTGTGTVAGMDLTPTYDLTNKPGFTGPKKGKRGGRFYGRWLSGVL